MLAERLIISCFRVFRKVNVFDVDLSTLFMNDNTTEAEHSHLCQQDVLRDSHNMAADTWVNGVCFKAFFIVK